jgi:DNA-binding response OmpR family regulator/anti-sigma regulatory factor (Ser/Thr protein kinase)
MAFDSAKMQTILVNLISNALKFTPDGGKIEVALQTNPSLEKETLPEQVEIEVKDNGTGIAQNELDKIFDRFYQADDSMTRKSEGTGVGLALVQELVKLMQGKIGVESREGSGTCFRVTLPYMPPVAGFTEVEISPAPVYYAQNSPELTVTGTEEYEALPLILIVEDNPDVRFYIAGTVRSDYRIATAENGALGIQMAKELVPDIIISDVMMPEKDGFILCETLKNDEITSHIPIILLTARADFESRIAGLKRGADAYLAKPFEPAELLAHLANQVKIRRRLQQRYSGLPNVPISLHEDQGVEMEDAFLAKIRLVVESNLDASDFDVPELGRAMAMSRSQLFRKVKALTDASPSVLIRTIRLQKSLELLQDKELTVAEIAYRVGFSSPTYFSTAFSEQYGKSPTEWRQS